MAVTIHNATLTAGPASANSRGLLHTTTADSCLLVWLHTNEAVTFSSCVANAVSLTRLGAISAGVSRAELWGMTSPAAGTLNISAAVTGNNPATWCMVATSYVGQKINGSPFGTVVGNSASATAAVMSVSATSVDLVAFAFGASAGAAITLGNGTLRADATHSTTGRLVVGDIVGAATISISATAASGVAWALFGIPIIAASNLVKLDKAAATGTSVVSNSLGLLLTATTDAVLVVFAHIAANATISAINAGAGALTFLGAVDYRAPIGAWRAEVWGLTAPASGVLTISAALVGVATSANFGMGAMTYVGHRTTATPFGGVVVGSTTSTASTSLIISSTAVNVVAMIFGLDEANASVGPAGVIERADFNPAGGNPAFVIADAPGATLVTASAAASAGQTTWFGNIGINIIASGVAAGATSAIAAMTDVADTFTASGYVIVRGSLAATDTPDKFTAIAKTHVSGVFAATDTPDNFTAVAKVRVSGLFAATDAPDTFIGTAAARITAVFAATDAPDILAASGTSSAAPATRTAVFAATDAPDIFIGTAQVRVSGLFAATDVPDTFVASGAVAPSFITAVFVATDQPDTFVALATSDPATGSSPPAVVTTIVADPGSGGGHRKPQYIRASRDFWDSRERYLKSLQCELEEEPDPHEVPTEVPACAAVTQLPFRVDPSLLANYRIERNDVITAIPLANTMRELRAFGEQLKNVNRLIAEQKQAELAFKQAVAKRRQLRAKRIKRTRVLLATLEVAQSVVRLYGSR